LVRASGIALPVVSGNIVDAERGGANQPIDFLKPHMAGVVMFQ
jgi:hypothetical protein